MENTADSGKLVIISAPSGAGKTTIVKHLIENIKELEFSISACSRNKRPGEIYGKDYYFLSPKEFKDKIDNDEFVEWEEVYQGKYYGTLKTEVNRIWEKGHHVLFEVDVKGGMNVMKKYPNRSLSIFIKPPSIEELQRRLKRRGAENDEEINARLKKAGIELQFTGYFNKVVINDDIEQACKETEQLVRDFLFSSI
ncbi:MAG: guanylate kinase [Bacteroidota bacterium]